MRNRIIKFRAFSKIKKRMFPVFGLGQYWVTEDTLDGVDPGNNCFMGSDFLNDIIVMQFTGLKDRNGVEIFEGDVIMYRRPYRSTQTHTGDNIPNGSYTEPMEPAIETLEQEVVFKDGIFGVIEQIDIIPLFWIIPSYDEDEIKHSISVGKPGWDIWDSPDEGDLQYLLDEYSLNNVEELIEYCNCFKVIGNIHQNPELLK